MIIKSYDFALQQKGVKWNNTMGLFWARPEEFINLDAGKCSLKSLEAWIDVFNQKVSMTFQDSKANL